MVTPFEISDEYVTRLAKLDPLFATSLGLESGQESWPDFSPAGYAEVAALHRETVAAVSEHLDHPDIRQRHAARVVRAYARQEVERYEQGDHLYALNHIVSPFQAFREVFEIMDTSTPEGRQAVIARLGGLSEPYEALRETLCFAIAEGKPVSKRQVMSVIEQAEDLAGPVSAYEVLRRRFADTGNGAYDDRLSVAIDSAKAEAARFARWLRTDYLPHAVDEDGVGEERYGRAAEAFLGLVIDPIEVYDWAWEELDRLAAEMRRVGVEIAPDLDVPGVFDMLETDPRRAASGVDEFVEFIRTRQQIALAALSGVHFEVDPRIGAITVNVTPPGGALGAHYVPPSEDFNRPGGIWYSLASPDHIPLYQEVSTAYHEGFPGHHLQVASTMARAEELSRAQRSLIWYSGFGEGWALYTERLMHELGFFEKPEYVFGMLAGQTFRAVRIVVDIGLHLGLSVPDAAPLHPGRPWDFDLGVEYVRRVGFQPPDYAASEVKRYLGWPGQAISYKVGEREILAIRDEARRAAGATFDLAAFHTRMLSAGDVRLDMLREWMA